VGADVKDAQSGLDSISSTIGKFGGIAAVGMAAGGAAIGGFVAMAVKGAAEVETSIANISTIKPDIDTSAMAASLNQMSTKIPQSAGQLGDALYNVFSSVDVSSAEGLALVEKFSKGAVGASTDAQTFGTAAMGVMNAYKLSVGDADHISDVFFNTVKSGVVTGAELAANLGVVTQSAKAAGVDLDTMGAMIAGVTKEGGPAAQNMNNLANMFQKIVTKESVAGIKSLGIATQDAGGDIRPVLDVMAEMKDKLGGMTEAARASALQAIFPDAQARMGAQTIMSQLDNVNTYLKDNQTVVGATEAAYKKMSSTFQSQSKLLGNTFQSILATVGGKLLPAITPLVTAFAQSLPGAFQAFETATKPLFDTIGNLVTYFGKDNKFDLMGSLFGPDLGPKIDEVVRKIGSIGSAIVGLVTGSTGLGTLGIILGDALGSMGELGGTILGKVGEAIGGINWTALKDKVGDFAGSVGRALGGALGTLGEFGGMLLGKAGEAIAAIKWDGVWAFAGDIGGQIGNALGNALGKVGTLAAKLGAWLGNAVGAIQWDQVWWYVQGLGTAFSATVGPITKDLETWLNKSFAAIDWNATLAGVKGADQGVADWIKTWDTDSSADAVAKFLGSSITKGTGSLTSSQIGSLLFDFSGGIGLSIANAIFTDAALNAAVGKARDWFARLIQSIGQMSLGISLPSFGGAGVVPSGTPGTTYYPPTSAPPGWTPPESLVSGAVSRMVSSGANSGYGASPVMASRSSGLQPVHLHIALPGGDQVEELFGDPRTVQRIIRHLDRGRAYQGARS